MFKIGTTRLSNSPRERGFSLVELMVVVGLISIGSGFAFATLMPYGEQYRVKSATFQLAADMQRTRMEAIRTRVCHFFDRTNPFQYRIVRDNTAALNCTLGADDITVRTINIGTLFPGVRFDQGPAETDPFGSVVVGPAPTAMRFEPRGLVTATGGSSLFVKSNNYGPWAVTVTAAGAVRTWRKDASVWK